jgi:hypothetical protein
VLGNQQRLEVIGNSGAKQRQLTDALPFVQKARDYSGKLIAIAKGKYAQFAATEMLPPGEKPIRSLERRRAGLRTGKGSPGGSELF